MGVIYVRPNLINGKKYVGQATDLKIRQNNWKCLTQKYAGEAINNARAKYGIDNFGFEILRECEDEELDYWEKYYIKKLNTKVPYGYNMTDGGDGKNGCPVSEETKRKISEGHKGLVRSQETRKKMSEKKKGIPNIKLSKPVLQIDKNTNQVIAEFPSVREIERIFGYSNQNISACCNEKPHHNSAYGYIWKYAV